MAERDRPQPDEKYLATAEASEFLGGMGLRVAGLREWALSRLSPELSSSSSAQSPKPKTVTLSTDHQLLTEILAELRAIRQMLARGGLYHGALSPNDNPAAPPS